jgi:hypothetical protein
MMAAFKLVASIAVATAAVTAKEWKADLNPVGESGVSGRATVSTTTPSMTDSMQAKAKFTADVIITGAGHGASHPWHVHAGSCGSTNAPIVGMATDYAPITVDSTGNGKASATVVAELAPDGQYLVNIHKSADDLTVISCGDLKAAGPVPESGR